jgi:hypothetical protein
VEQWLKSVLARIADGSLLPAEYYGELDCDAALDARHDPPFDAAWVQQSDEVEPLWAAAALSADAQELAEEIRREAFLAVSRATGQHEIASYVSDDFELVVHGRLAGVDSSFLNQLWAAYERGQFPMPPL